MTPGWDTLPEGTDLQEPRGTVSEQEEEEAGEEWGGVCYHLCKKRTKLALCVHTYLHTLAHAQDTSGREGLRGWQQENQGPGRRVEPTRALDTCLLTDFKRNLKTSLPGRKEAQRLVLESSDSRVPSVCSS